MKELNERYAEWLWAQFHKGHYGKVFDRMSQKTRLFSFQQAVKNLIEERPPEKDKEFMDRVGDQFMRVSKRVVDL